MAAASAGSTVSTLQSSGNQSVADMSAIQEVEQQVEVASMALSAMQAEGSVMEGAGQGVQQTAGAAGQSLAHGAHAS